VIILARRSLHGRLHAPGTQSRGAVCSATLAGCEEANHSDTHAFEPVQLAAQTSAIAAAAVTAEPGGMPDIGHQKVEGAATSATEEINVVPADKRRRSCG
jgi:hypothetical protein